MGRKKISIAKIQDDRNRQVRFLALAREGRVMGHGESAG